MRRCGHRPWLRVAAIAPRQGGELLGEFCSLGPTAEVGLPAPVARGGRLVDRQQWHARDRNNRILTVRRDRWNERLDDDVLAP